MSEQDVETVRNTYEAFNRGDIPAVLANYQPDIEWIEPGGGNAPSGTFNGTDQVEQEVFGKVPESFGESFLVQVDEIKDEGDKVVASGRFKGHHTSGADLDAAFEHVADMKDGKLARFENKPDVEAWAKGWGG
jgi:ketosteroid isomerase-like protein